METPGKMAARLLLALEDLAAQEAGFIRAGEMASAIAVSERAAPLVGKLCQLSAEPDVIALRERVSALIAKREVSARQLGEHLARLSHELRRVDAAQGRASRVAPTYGGRSRVSESRFNTAA